MSDFLPITTPQGRLIEADLQYRTVDGQPSVGISNARVVDPATGVEQPLTARGVNHLAQMARNKALADEARAQFEHVMNSMPQLLRGFMETHHGHPGVQPYEQELSHHETLAKRAGDQLAQLNVRLGNEADRIADGRVPSVPNTRGDIQKG